MLPVDQLLESSKLAEALEKDLRGFFTLNSSYYPNSDKREV